MAKFFFLFFFYISITTTKANQIEPTTNKNNRIEIKKNKYKIQYTIVQSTKIGLNTDYITLWIDFLFKIGKSGKLLSLLSVNQNKKIEIVENCLTWCSRSL